MTELLIATNNIGKQKEFIKILSDVDVSLLFPKDFGLEDFEVDETGSTCQENAYLKASQFANKAGIPAVADDSGIEVDSLDGFPGIKSKRFFPGSDSDRNNKLLELLKDKDDRNAQFRTVLSLYDPQTKKTEYFEGILRGSISNSVKGKEGFGYDPIFIPEGETETVAVLGLAFKNKRSHRFQAIKKLKKFLKK